MKKSGRWNMKFERVLVDTIDALMMGARLPAARRDHALKGKLRPVRECHIAGDVLLVYTRNEKERVVVLVDMGTHARLFGS